jgi:uncharacterized protein
MPGAPKSGLGSPVSCRPLASNGCTISVTGTSRSLDQDGNDRPLVSATFEHGLLRLTLTAAATFEGRLSADGGTIAGTWRERGLELPIAFSRVERLPGLRRPQTPQPPFPYIEEQVHFENARAGVRLAGTLTLPESGARHPAVLLISGSGPQDRDETIYGHKPFLVIADHLSRRGIAVLRVDDRGVGGSTGSRTGATSEDYAADARAAVDYLAGREEIDASRIGLVGHSEGGLIAPLVATRGPGVAFIVLLAAPGLPGDELSYLQGQTMLKAAGASAEHLELQGRTQRGITEVLKQETDEAVMRRRIDRVIVEAIGEDGAAILRQSVESQLQQALRPWARFFLFHDPRPVLKAVRCPVLALNGSTDTQVPAAPNLAAIRAALGVTGTVVELPGLNHLFQTSATGALAEYGKIEETFAPAALTAMSDWIAGVVRRQ